jgi:hypothetical protein
VTSIHYNNIYSLGALFYEFRKTAVTSTAASIKGVIQMARIEESIEIKFQVEKVLLTLPVLKTGLSGFFSPIQSS